MSAPGSWIEVDLAAIRGNLARIRDRIGPGPRILVLVKADGYGHGAVETARCVLEAGADRVGVARIGEGIHLRRNGVAGPIHVLEPFHPLDLDEYVEHDLLATVCDLAAAQCLSEHGVRSGKPLTAHVKVDTGMSRLGLHAVRDRDLIRLILSLPGVEWEGIFTHFSRADEDGSGTSEQFGAFQELLESLDRDGLRPPVAHAANSAAIFLHSETHLQMVRPGLAVYGYPPPGCTDSGLVPALRLRSTIRHLSWKEPGECVSYGGTWTAARRTRLAVLPLGYGDGFWRGHSGRLSVEIRGVLCPQVGRICMDQMMIDTTDLPEVALGDPAWIIAPREGLSAVRLSENLGTIVYEVLCDLGRRLERRYIG